MVFFVVVKLQKPEMRCVVYDRLAGVVNLSSSLAGKRLVRFFSNSCFPSLTNTFLALHSLVKFFCMHAGSSFCNIAAAFMIKVVVFMSFVPADSWCWRWCPAGPMLYDRTKSIVFIRLTHNYCKEIPIINHFNDNHIRSQLLGWRRQILCHESANIDWVRQSDNIGLPSTFSRKKIN